MVQTTYCATNEELESPEENARVQGLPYLRAEDISGKL